jgi:hypothetical protein
MHTHTHSCGLSFSRFLSLCLRWPILPDYMKMYVCVRMCAYVCVYVCIGVCVRVCKYVCMYTHIHTTTFTHMRGPLDRNLSQIFEMYAHIACIFCSQIFETYAHIAYIYINTHTYIHIYIYTYIYIYIYIYICTHTHIYTHTYTSISTWTNSPNSAPKLCLADWSNGCLSAPTEYSRQLQRDWYVYFPWSNHRNKGLLSCVPNPSSRIYAWFWREYFPPKRPTAQMGSACSGICQSIRHLRQMLEEFGPASMQAYTYVYMYVCFVAVYVNPSVIWDRC